MPPCRVKKKNPRLYFFSLWPLPPQTLRHQHKFQSLAGSSWVFPIAPIIFVIREGTMMSPKANLGALVPLAPQIFINLPIPSQTNTVLSLQAGCPGSACQNLGCMSITWGAC